MVFLNFNILESAEKGFWLRRLSMIIDIHAHIWGSRVESDKANILTAMDRYGIDRVYVSGLRSKVSDEAEIAFLNAAVAQYIQE